MTRRERLTATLRGEPVDRPAVNFYEVGGRQVDPADPDEFNIYNTPSWRALLQLAEEHTDLIRMGSAAIEEGGDSGWGEFFTTETYTADGSRFQRTTATIGGRTLTSLTRRDPQVHTVWTLEHLLKDTDDLKAYLELPDEIFRFTPDVTNLRAADEKVGDRGIVMVDVGDPICSAAALFSMEDYLIVALTEQKLFHRLLEKLAGPIQERTEKIAREFPGHLWRICGPEYAAEPYLPPRLFDEYVVRYTRPVVQAIEAGGGYARIHCHGRLKAVLPSIAAMGASALDPIEPPPQGDVLLTDVRRRYGKDLVLFGNIEASDLANLEPRQFEKVVAKSLQDGTAGQGRGFVLMPSACPCGREITPRTMKNYETMVRLATGLAA